MTEGATTCSRNLGWPLKDEEDAHKRAEGKEHPLPREDQVQRLGETWGWSLLGWGVCVCPEAGPDEGPSL